MGVSNYFAGVFVSIHEVIKAFGGVSETAKALGVTRQTVYNWRRSGEMPEHRQIQAMALLREIGANG